MDLPLLDADTFDKPETVLSCLKLNILSVKLKTFLL